MRHRAQVQILPTRKEVRTATPGLALVVLPIIAVSEVIYWVESSYVQAAFHVPAPVIAIMIAGVISIITTNVIQLPARYGSGLQFTTRWLLKAGIVLYGFNFSYILWFQPGAGWILLISLVTVFVPLAAAYYFGRLLGLDSQSRLLVGVGTGVCGISAILATQQATKYKEEAAGMALATILVFGTIVLFAYPPLGSLLSLSKTVYGIWTGATTLDLPQLVAAALQGGGSESLAAGLWVKSIRIGLLAPVILAVILMTVRNKISPGGAMGKSSSFRAALNAFPLFIIVFFLAILFNTVYPLPSWLAIPLSTGKGEFLGLNIANLLLTTAIIGICFRVRRDVIGKTGVKILLTGGLAWGIQSLLVFWLANGLPIPRA